MKPAQLLLGFLFLAIIVGCGDAARQALALRRSNLATVGLGYHEFFAVQGRGPADADEFCEFLLSNSSGDETIDNACKSVRELDVVVYWNGVLNGDANLDQYVLAFEASCPGSGGYLVTAGGTIELVTAKKFSEMEALPTAEPTAVETSDQATPSADAL